MEHYVSLFDTNKQNDREKVLKNTYDLNELLHKMDIDERLRSQFVGTTLLYLKNLVERFGAKKIDEELKKNLDAHWSVMDGKQLRAAIESTLESLLDGSDNKAKKIELLQKNVLNDQKVKKLTITHWIKILDTILMDIYQYIDTNSSEGQDILNLFFIAFNKYTGKADKNQAFTPDHITEFKFSYGRKWTLENMNSTVVKLPVKHNKNGTPCIDSSKKYSEEGYVPDWAFMEEYIKSLPYGDRL